MVKWILQKIRAAASGNNVRTRRRVESVCRQEAAGVHRARRGDRLAQRSTASLEAEPEVA